MIRTRIITYPTNVNWPTLAEPGPITSGGPAPPTWPDAPAASLETINAIAHEFAHERP
jgi:hypothetical protein